MPEQLPELVVPFMRRLYLDVIAEFRARGGIVGATSDLSLLLLHHVGRLTNVIIHVNPPEGTEAHARTAHHQAAS